MKTPVAEIRSINLVGTLSLIVLDRVNTSIGDATLDSRDTMVRVLLAMSSLCKTLRCSAMLRLDATRESVPARTLSQYIEGVTDRT